MGFFKARFAEIVLVILIILNILDFLKFLPVDVDFTKKILSWVIVAFLFYEVSFTWLFFGGEREEKFGILPHWVLDLSILAFYLILFAKDLVGISEEGGVLFSDLMGFLEANLEIINMASIYIGFIGLFIVSLYLSLFAKIHKDSLLGNFGFSGRNALFKFIGIFLVLNGFYILVFDLLMEWLGIAVDSTLIVVGVFFYIVFILRHHKKFSPDSLIYKIGSFGENFEERFLKFFHDKRYLGLGITGLLVLHILTEVSNFLLPYLFNLNNSLYFHELSQEPIYTMIFNDVMQGNLLVVGLGYVFNIICMLSLILIPAVIWWEIYKERVHTIPRIFGGLFMGSLPVFLYSPLFSLKAIKGSNIVGVEFITNSILKDNLWFMVIIGVIVALIFMLSGNRWFVRRGMYHIMVFFGVMYFFYYLFLFYESTFQYLVNNITMLWERGIFLIPAFLTMLLVIKLLFVVGGGIAYLVQISKKHLW